VGLLRPSSGRIVAFGSERRVEADFHEVRRRAGYVFQDPDDQLFCPTVAEDLAFGPLNLGKSREEALATAERTLALLGLSAFRDRITHHLSGGEKRLVSLAAVMAMEPDVLLLDEPTTALDEGTTERLREILLDLPQAMVLVTHDPAFRGAVATRAVALRGGAVAEGA
jgi:cobalt/nickel transport system ATP-binding protein